MTTRRDFLRRTSLALAGGLVLGDEALALFERLTHHKVFALGQMPNLLDLNLTTNFTAGVFSIFAKPGPAHTGFARVTIDGQPADIVEGLPGGVVRVARYLGKGKIEARGAIVMANGIVHLSGAQLEDGTFPSSFIPTAAKPVTRAAESLSLPISAGTRIVAGEPLPPAAVFTRASAAWYVDQDGRIQMVPADVPRSDHFIQKTRVLLVEGKRTNFALWSEPPT